MRKMIMGALVALGVFGLSACSHAGDGAAANTAGAGADDSGGNAAAAPGNAL